MPTRTLYLISGLGVDERIFQKLRLPGCNLIHIRWITPYRQETLSAYAMRLAEQIDISKPFYLLGLSFGGMLAVEIAKQFRPERTILVSSAARANAIPLYLRIAGAIHLEALLPASILTSANPVSYWLFGTRTKEEKMLLKAILADTDPQFLKWALRAIADWDNTVVPENIVQMHGMSDRILPGRKSENIIWLKGGGHFMIYSRADEMSELIASCL